MKKGAKWVNLHLSRHRNSIIRCVAGLGIMGIRSVSIARCVLWTICGARTASGLKAGCKTIGNQFVSARTISAALQSVCVQKWECVQNVEHAEFDCDCFGARITAAYWPGNNVQLEIKSTRSISEFNNQGEARECRNLDIRNSMRSLGQLRNCTVVYGFLQIVLLDDDDNNFTGIAFPDLRWESAFSSQFKMNKFWFPI